jgi:uncharacterized protein (TIGR03437 family)
VVESAGAAGDPVTVEIAPTQPGVFADAATELAAVIYAADGLSPWHRAAKPGEFLQIFATGLGAVSPRVETGEAAPALTLSRTVSAPRVVIGGRALEPSFSGLAPFFSGLCQINVQLPADIAAGSYELSIETAEGRSNAALLPVQAP